MNHDTVTTFLVSGGKNIIIFMVNVLLTEYFEGKMLSIEGSFFKRPLPMEMVVAVSLADEHMVSVFYYRDYETSTMDSIKYNLKLSNVNNINVPTLYCWTHLW